MKLIKKILAFSLVGFIVSFSTLGYAVPLNVISFNIQFLGHFKNKDNVALAKLLSPNDLVFIQELVAPHHKANFPMGPIIIPTKNPRLFLMQ